MCSLNTDTQTVTLTIDGKAVTVPKGTTVYQAAKQLEIDIPVFCYQDRMPPFGACRMCLVEVEKMAKLQASCTLEAIDGMVVKTQSKRSVDGRKEIIELLLINHPLDCPICDRGGECPLQDHALKHGPGESRFFEEKRHFKKPLPLGPVLMLDRERCIVCARCTRFGDTIAGDHALEFIERGYRTEVGTPGGGPADSKFIGNTIMICPVGALTSQVYRFRARPWDNDPTNTTCTLCPVGCSMILDARDGEIVRTRSRENREINDIWLCDKGWFGYEFATHADRLKEPLVRRGDQFVPISWEDALSRIAEKLDAARAAGKVAGWGGNPLTTEENYLFQKLLRQVVGVNHLDHRIGMPIIPLEEEGISAGMEMAIGECEELSYVILCGLDITEEFPVIWLRLRQAINRGATSIFLGHFAPEIAPYLTQTTLHAPGQELEAIRKNLTELQAWAKKGKGALLVGRQYLASPHRRAILAELNKLRQSTPDLSLNLLEGRGNSLGARLAGMRPEFGPLGEQMDRPGLSVLQVLEAASKDGWDVLYVAGSDPAAKLPTRLWQEARSKLGFLVVQDLFLTQTAREADLVLPVLAYTEKEGSFINIEGRVQHLQAGQQIPENSYSDAEIFGYVAQRLGFDLSIEKRFIDRLRVAKRLPMLRPTSIESGNVTTTASTTVLKATFAHALFDQGERMRHNTHLIQLVKEPAIRLSSNEGKKRGIRTGDHIRVSANGTSFTAKAKLDDKVADGTVVLPLGFKDVPSQELSRNGLNDFVVEIFKTEFLQDGQDR